MPKIDWKKIGKTALSIGAALFPVVNTIEKLTKFKELTGKEKQDLAFDALHDELIASLLPGEAQDPQIEVAIRKLVDDAVAFNNILAEIRAKNATK